MSSSKAVSDNLTRITRIGPARQRWFRETLNVRTFRDLAALSAKEIESRLKAEGQITSRLEIEEWIAQAQQLAASANQSSQRDGGSTEAKVQGKANSPVREDHWDTLALYFIEFQSRQVPGKPVELQTKVVFEGPGPQAQRDLPGIEQDRICQWIFEHVGRILRDMPATEAPLGAETMVQEVGPSAISVSQLRLFQPAGVGSPLFSYSSDRPQLSMVKADQPFDLEAILEGSRPQASTNGQSTFNVRFLVKNWNSNDYTTLGNVEPDAIRDQMAYSALLPGISLPRGQYRLQALVLAHPRPVILGSIEIPLLNVW